MNNCNILISIDLNSDWMKREWWLDFGHGKKFGPSTSLHSLVDIELGSTATTVTLPCWRFPPAWKVSYNLACHGDDLTSSDFQKQLIAHNMKHKISIE